jgi:dynein heavy chain
MASEAQKDIDEAIPAIEASIKALETVERNDLKDIRGMSKPPQLVKFVLEAVSLLMGCKLV